MVCLRSGSSHLKYNKFYNKSAVCGCSYFSCARWLLFFFFFSFLLFLMNHLINFNEATRYLTSDKSTILTGGRSTEMSTLLGKSGPNISRRDSCSVMAEREGKKKVAQEKSCTEEESGKTMSVNTSDFLTMSTNTVRREWSTELPLTLSYLLFHVRQDENLVREVCAK